MVERIERVDCPLAFAWEAVADVYRYGDFLPGCQGVQLDGTPAVPAVGGAALQVQATMQLGVGGLHTQLLSQVQMQPPGDGEGQGQVDVRCSSPPMRQLRALWRLQAEDGGARTQVSFRAEVSFASLVWSSLFRLSGDRAVEMVTHAFCQRALLLLRQSQEQGQG